MVRITMQNGKTIDLELDAQAAPITCRELSQAGQPEAFTTV